ncbi:MAG: KpsF/GutQ family sugar-phosphate isomerase [Gammaproteobacteria bacterium]|nr:KpsF/GutQ family sugar-phosphate isomerase [Gammaproteobacteria bacterium]MYJ52478.1 KpsF/GutQ family sugar-phosphate isomerase [Gammaproteobacteria bacterium]
MSSAKILDQARSVIQIEADAIGALLSRLDENFARACRMLMECQGRVVVIGMGKSGHVGGKIAATLASTGTPAFFLHPGEASHGDAGMITTEDLALTISNSGETLEIVTIIPIIKRLGVRMIAMTGNPDSTLAVESDICLDVSVEKEACPHNLAPTASTTATLVMGDALAVAVQHLRGFSIQDFARTHPGGVLGKRLLLYARDLMHTGDELPLVGPDMTLDEVLIEMSSKALGMVGIVDDGDHLLGMFTDGDLRRALENGVDIYSRSAGELMNRDPYTIGADTLAEQIVGIMREFAKHGPHALNGVFIVDKKSRVVGALNTHDLLRAGVI